MLVTIMALALAAAAPDAAKPPAPANPVNTVSGVTVSPRPGTGPIAATVDMASDDSELGDFTAIWPAGAYFKGGDGHVILACLIDIHGLAERCNVAEESPRNQGFGKAALELRPTFQLKPKVDVDGQPINAVMSLKVTFKAPRKDLVGVSGSQANVHSMHTGSANALEQFLGTKESLAGNALNMRAVTMLDDPVWTQAASFEDVAKAYPAKGGGVDGYAAAHCRIERSGDRAGSLRDCQIIKESPDGHDFGKAALGLTAKFHLASTVLAHAPSSTPVWVDVPIRFAPPSTLRDRTVMAPVWLRGVDPERAPKVFPPEAVAAGLTTGRGLARCTVGADGGLTGCGPEPGEPDGLGFSEAAAKLASGMKMNLWSADAAPVVGGVVHIPIRLNLKGG